MSSTVTPEDLLKHANNFNEVITESLHNKLNGILGLKLLKGSTNQTLIDNCIDLILSNNNSMEAVAAGIKKIKPISLLPEQIKIPFRISVATLNDSRLQSTTIPPFTFKFFEESDNDREHNETYIQYKNDYPNNQKSSSRPTPTPTIARRSEGNPQFKPPKNPAHPSSKEKSRQRVIDAKTTASKAENPTVLKQHMQIVLDTQLKSINKSLLKEYKQITRADVSSSTQKEYDSLILKLFKKHIVPKVKNPKAIYRTKKDIELKAQQAVNEFMKEFAEKREPYLEFTQSFKPLTPSPLANGPSMFGSPPKRPPGAGSENSKAKREVRVDNDEQKGLRVS